MLIDLHVHSRYSDGEFYPGELIPFVKEHGVSVVSITDHDTISGLDQAVKAGKEYGIAVIPGVELTTYFENVEVHILGYDIDYKNKKFLKIINNLRDKRFLRVKRMLAKLRQEGVDIHDKDIFKAEDIISGEVRMSYGRPHIAKVLYEKGFVKSFQHAFERYIGNDCKACLPKESFPTL